MPIYMTAMFQVEPKSVGKCKAAIAEMISHIGERDPGTRLYLALQHDDDPTRFLHVFAFADEEAKQVHHDAEYVRRFADVLYPETVAGVEFKSYSLVAVNKPV